MPSRLISIAEAFENPVTLWITVVICAVLVTAGIAISVINRSFALDSKLKQDISVRYRSWLILAPIMIVPIILGQIPTILSVAVLSLLAHREFARATGLFRDTLTSICVIVSILIVTFAALDNWYGLFVATVPLGIVFIAGVNVAKDKPTGYLQRVALGIMSFALFGAAFGHLGMLANDANSRPILLWLIFCVQINDVFAYITGKIFGHKKLLLNTSPGKTVAGAIGALILTSIAAVLIAPAVFKGTMLASLIHGLTLGLLISIMGQLGDLVISSIKRDVGIKDMGHIFPGHGGLLDRFDSLILAAPATFHYIHYFSGVANNVPVRIFSGS